MIQEIVTLQVKPELNNSFLTDFREAQQFISSREGFLNLSLSRCVEDDCRYVMTVEWDRLENHTIGFRESEAYQDWKRLLHKYYEPFPEVLHFESIEL